MFKKIRNILLTMMLSTLLLCGTAYSWSDGWRDQLDWVAKSAAYTAQPGDNLLVDTTSAGVTITLPSTAKVGDGIRVVDSDSTFDSNNCTIARNGHNILSTASNLTLAVEGQYIHLIYVDTTVGWTVPTMAVSAYDPASVAITGGTINGATIGATTPSTGVFNKVTIAGTSEPALVISQTGITGTDNQAIDITGGEALGAEEHYTGIRIKPDDIDPGGADTRIRGTAINLSGVATTNVPESMECLRLVVPSGLTGAARDATDALQIIEGDIDQSVTIPATEAETFTLYDMVVDISSLHANSEVHGINMTAAGGTPSGEIVAIGTHSHVAPIHQHIGAFSTPSQTEYAGRKVGATWTDGIDGVEIFVANSNEIYVGSTAQFSELEVIFGTTGTKTVTPTFWYNTAADTWTQFFPQDATAGFTQSGSVYWPLGDISASWTNDGDPGGVLASTGYWIKIIRTAAPDPGTPTPTTVKAGIITEFHWDKNGDLLVRDIVLQDVLAFEGSTDDGYETTITASDPGADYAVTLQAKAGSIVIDGTACWDLEGTALSITTGILNVTEADPLSATKALDNLASVAISESLISDTAATDDLGSEALYWKKLYLDTSISFEGATDDTHQTTLSATDATTADRTITLQDADGIVAMDVTACTDLEGTGLAISTGTLNVTNGLASIAGLTEADVSVIEATANDTYSVVTSGGNDYLLGSNAGNDALEFKTPAGVKADFGLDYKTYWIPAGAFIPTTTNGADADSYEYTTNDNMVDYLAFDGATEEYAAFNLPMGEAWDRSTIKAKFYWTPGDSAATAGDTVEWKLAGQAISDDDALDVAMGDAGEVMSDTVLAGVEGSLHKTGASPAITVGGTPLLADMIHFKVSRNVDGTDDMTEDAWLLGVWIQYQVTNVTAAW